jgi:hypothetical protein
MLGIIPIMNGFYGKNTGSPHDINKYKVDFNKRFDESFNEKEMEIRRNAESIRAKRWGETTAWMVEQLSKDLEFYGFKKGEWEIKTDKLTQEGHFCPNCRIEDGSYITIQNKLNPEDTLSGWCDWVHLKPCPLKEPTKKENYDWNNFEQYVKRMKEGYLNEKYQPIDKKKYQYYWDLIKGSEELAKKYSIRLKKEFGIPTRILRENKTIFY